MAQKPLSPDLSDPRQSLFRSPSTASESTVRSTTYVSVPQANPPPAYVARDAASELITTEIDRVVRISKSALTLVNEFLDQVLYNILLTSRSTSLSSLKAVVPTVLKPRLGKAALRVAEDELKEYLEEEEEEELHARTNIVESKHDFDLDLAWRLARLRCMVYTRLGDLEEEDEEEWLEKDGLRLQLESTRQTSRAAAVTGPASAIFLTSIVEYLGEQALYYAAQHAQKRHSQHGNQQIRDEEAEFADLLPDDDDLVIGGKDMNHVGRDSPLSRLWRSYRRNTRDLGSRSMSPETRTTITKPFSHSRNSSSVPREAPIIEEERSPYQIPLPMSGNDINEIEIPGLAQEISADEGETDEDSIPEVRRRASMIEMPSGLPDLLIPSDDEPPAIPERSPLRPNWLRNRSISTPVTTLSKLNHSKKSTDALHGENNTINSRRSGGRRRPSLIKEHRSSQSGETVFGGAVAAVAGALGLGALGIASHKEPEIWPTSSEKAANYDDESPTKPSSPKRTVAEEMLGTPFVPPPKDAKTGSSITNMSDFYSMHVPVAATSGFSSIQGTPTPSTSRRNDYFSPPTTTKTGSESPSKATRTVLAQVDGAADSQETLRPAPLRTMSGRKALQRPGTADSGHVQPSSTDREVAETLAGTVNDAPQQSQIAAVQTPVTAAIPPRVTSKESTRARHTKTDSRGSVIATHSRNTSSNSQAIGLARSTSDRASTTSQQRPAGMVNGNTQNVNVVSTSAAAKDARPGTSNSVSSKRLQVKPAKLGEESDEAKKKSLEILIRGNETLHYTLTPAAAMRDEQPVSQKVRTPTQDMAESVRSTAPVVPDQNARARLAALNSNPPDPPLSPKVAVQQAVTPLVPRSVVSPVSPSRQKNPLGEPRDARTEKASTMRDLADYARSTGPLDAKQLPKSIGPRPPSATSPRPATTISQMEASTQEARSTSRSSKPANRLKYQARDARLNRNDDTSDLIDFIREGPPRDPNKEHRIDRKVAPFRTTMDSEDFNSLSHGNEEGVSSLKEYEDSHMSNSVDPSVTSQTPLIVTNGQSNRAVISKQTASDSEGMPQRTRRRIKDPYAIYDSDDDDLEEDTSKASRNQEESLIDFLRNTAPTTTQAQPIRSPVSQLRSQHLEASGARADSPHLTQVGSKIDKYRPTQPTHAAHVERNRAAHSASAAGSARSRSAPRFEARDAKATRVNTSELAEYLKNSGPPPNAQYQPQPFVLLSTNPPPGKVQPAPPKEDKNIFKRFSKVKK